MSIRINRPEDIGALIRDRRRSLALSQSALGERLGVSRKWVSELERGKSTAHLGLALRALRDLGVSLVANLEKTAETPTSVRPRISIDRIVDG